ncbi:MAG: sigma-70 family RNA polymerase sigma factor [Chloroflexota bacterium]|jgi:RNA polymerase sigma-70 factor (ECF subfamily)
MDVELVIRAQQGDQQAFASIARSIAIRLRKMAYGVLRDMDLAEESAQQAIVTIWRELPRLRDPRRFDAWCYRVLARVCYAERRRIRKHEATSLDGVSRLPSASDISHGVLLRDQLERGFARLSLEHRAVVVLHHQFGLPLDEVAEALDIPTGTVKSRLHRAMGQLRASLEADLRHPSPVPASNEAVR